MIQSITKEYDVLVDNENIVFITTIKMKDTLIFYKIKDFIIENQNMDFDSLASAVKTMVNNSKHKIEFYEEPNEFGVYYNSRIFPIHVIYKYGKYRSQNN